MTDYFDIPRDVRDALDTQSERTGDGQSAPIAEVIEFRPGEPAPDALIFDPRDDALDAMWRELDEIIPGCLDGESE